MGTRTRAATIAAALALALTACGNDEPEIGGGSDAFSDVDPCSLLTEQDISAHLLGEKATPKRATNEFDRPSCTWGNPDASSHEVKLMLWQPPLPDVQKDSPSLPVGDRKGYVSIARSGGCMMDIDAGRAWLQFDTSVPAPEDGSLHPKNWECERVAKLGEKAIDKLGW